MSLYGKRSFSLLLFLLFSIVAVSQEISPYSRFGLGQVDNPVFTAQRGLGGLSSTYRNALLINFMNPASYSSIMYGTLEAGIKATTKNIEDGQTGKTYRAGDGFIDYLAFAMPIRRAGLPRAGLSFGFVPYSSMNYNFKQSQTYNVGSAQKSYEGNGRTYQLYLGGAYRFQKLETAKNNFSLGANFVYLFGSLHRNELVRFSPPEYYNTLITSAARLSNFAFNTGLQYKRNISDSLYFTVGAYSLFPVAVTSKVEDTWARYIVLGNNTYVDTVHRESGTNSALKIPVEAGGGMSVGRPYRWMLGVEFKYKIWSEVESFSPDATLENSWEVRVGTELSPKPTKSFFKKLTYRLGGFYDSGYLNIDGTMITEAGGSFGISIPIIQSTGSYVFTNSRLNFSFDAGTRGTTSNGLVKETFFRASIGFMFNETNWFKKRLLD